MPSPLNGLTEPPASPTTSQLGPTLGLTEPAMGRRPPVGSPSALSGEIPQWSGAVMEYSSSRWDVFTLLKSRNVSSRPTPTLIVPSPTGKIHP